MLGGGRSATSRDGEGEQDDDGKSLHVREGSVVEVEPALGEDSQQVRQLRKPAFALLREDNLAVGLHVELALLSLLHLGHVPEAVQLGHETRGPLVVAVSDGAVEDADVRHARERTAGQQRRGEEDEPDREEARAPSDRLELLEGLSPAPISQE